MTRIVCFLSHYATAVWALYAGYTLAKHYGLIALPYWYGLAPLVLLLVAGLCQLRHTRILCARCVKAIPLNGPELAEKRARALKTFHYFSRLLPVILIGGLIWILAGGSWVMVWFLILSCLEMRHRRVRLWCPRCRNGGDYKPAHDPLPTSSGSR